MLRRTVLAALAKAPLLALGLERTAAAQVTPRLKALKQEAAGTTLFLGLPEAPFAGTGHGDDTVIVFVPDRFRYASAEGVSALVHFHGHNSAAERAMLAHSLREQLVDSRQNAILIVPQLALMANDSACGRLAMPDGLARLVRSAVAGAARFGRQSLGDARFPERAPLGRVCLSAHSGGYHAAACSLRVGALEVSETYLFDALYGHNDVFRDWMLARRGNPVESRHKLVSYFTKGSSTDPQNRVLRSELERGGLLVVGEQREGELSRKELSHADAVFIRTEVGHSTVPWETNALRDVLYASMLPRHLDSNWFAKRRGSRPIERRR
ncbi:MAG: hypothetical protein QM756_09065 [Polyangiaceae bacterium]